MIDNYHVDAFGVIHQVKFTPIGYDREYLSRYVDLSKPTIKLGHQLEDGIRLREGETGLNVLSGLFRRQ